MSTPHELRDRLSKSSFFTQIATKVEDEDDVQFLESSSSLLFGINQSDSSLVQVRLTGSQPVSTHSPLPVHHVDHIKHSPGGSLALWSKLGCSVIKQRVYTSRNRANTRHFSWSIILSTRVRNILLVFIELANQNSEMCNVMFDFKFLLVNSNESRQVFRFLVSRSGKFS